MDSRVGGPALRLDNGLTEKQDIFAREVAKGSTLIDAYKAAYDTSNMKQGTMYSEASKLADHPIVSERIRHLMELRSKRTHALDAMRIRQHVFDRLMAESVDMDNPAASRVRSLELLGKIDIVQMFREPKEAPVPTEESVKDLQDKLRGMLAKLVDVTPLPVAPQATQEDDDARSAEEDDE